jgi:hypothetical protein
MQRRLHDPLDRAVHLVQRLRQTAPELFLVQPKALGIRAASERSFGTGAGRRGPETMAFLRTAEGPRRERI